MIKLTLNSEAEALSQSFSKECVYIGTPAQENIDFKLPELSNETHLSITKEDDLFRIRNLNNSPAVTLNGNSFEETVIESGANIVIDGQSLTFQVTEDELEEEEKALDFGTDESDPLFGDFPEEELTEAPPAPKIEAEEMDVINELFDDTGLDLDEATDSVDLSEEDIDELVKQVDEFLVEEEAPEETVEEPAVLEKDEAEESLEEPTESSTDSDNLVLDFQDDHVDEDLNAMILKQQQDESLGVTQGGDKNAVIEGEWSDIEEDIIDAEEAELEKETDAEPDVLEEHLEVNPQNSEPFLSKKLIAVASLLIMVGSLVAFLTVTRIQNGHAKEELMAARGLADVAMALSHAELQNQIPYHHQWSDPDFIHENLASVLSSKYLAINDASSSNGFVGDSYHLRVFVQQSPFQFVLLAEPKNSWSQLIAPKAGFLINSETMQVRREQSTQSWEKTFRNQTYSSLKEKNTLEKLVNNSSVVRLSYLNNQSMTAGFTAPRDLVYLLPHGEATIYNAPRYYRFTEPLFDQILKFPTEELSEHEKAVATYQVHALSRFPHLVLYTTRGADAVKQALGVFEDQLPEGQKLLLGYVTLDEQSGLVANADLLIEESTLALLEKMAQSKGSGSLPEQGEEQQNQILDTTHPLFITLMELSNQRRDDLKAISQQIVTLLNYHDQKESKGFYEIHHSLIEQYDTTSKSYQVKISRVLQNLYDDYVTGNPDEYLPLYLASVKATELELLLPEGIRESAASALGSDSSPMEIDQLALTFDQLLTKVDESVDLAKLSETVRAATNWLSDKGSRDSDEGISRQRQLKAEVLKKLGQFLLAPNTTLAKKNFQEHNRELLADILNRAQVNEAEERKFYLQEFDLLIHKFRKVSHETVGALQDIKENLEDSLKNAHELDPEFRESLQVQKLAAEEEITRNRGIITGIKDQITRVPLQAAATNPGEQQENYGRLGQQILIQESLNPPSEERDLNLYRAIGLLSQATDDSRSLWGDILEARRLISETPKTEIFMIMDSDLGLSKSRSPLAAAIRKNFKSYIRAKQSLARSRNAEQFKTQFEAFQQIQANTLETISVDTQQVQSKARRLIERFDEYVNLLEQFERDYQRAQDEGFFATDHTYHGRMKEDLQSKLRAVKKVRKTLFDTSHKLIQASQEHEQLAQEELSTIAIAKQPNKQEIADLQRRNNRISYPNILSDNLSSKIQHILKQEIFPIPQ